jgi:hypothetical protein
MGTIACPNHGGSFDCTPFCRICGGDGEYSTPGEPEYIEWDAVAVRYADDGTVTVAAVVTDGRACGPYIYAAAYIDGAGYDVAGFFRDSLREYPRRQVAYTEQHNIGARLAALVGAEPWVTYRIVGGMPVRVEAVRS